MVTCPKCGQPVGGRARRCGYCGESLVSEYFGNPGQEKPSASAPSAAAVAATVLGILGALSLLGALVFRLLPLFGFWETPEVGISWWIGTLFLTALPISYLVAQALLRGERRSFLPDVCVLFVSVLGTSLTAQLYLEQGSSPFYGPDAVPYLLTLGFVLIAVASIVFILSFQSRIS